MGEPLGLVKFVRCFDQPSAFHDNVDRENVICRSGAPVEIPTIDSFQRAAIYDQP